ncbi:hypothetical protein C2S53_012545 [Perilla frutescens var. hirtella]|uniref:Uncharacterized protein n=1 Tax=Perilla frutescens var. hirtella TaxID=608512 RepID=A0AAD4JMQ6_PERFH|nr:hypothetical protein C2S53_012545 [Perilla frutescens var. hirtella]
MSPSMATSFNSWKNSGSKSIRLGQTDYEYSSSNHKWLTLWRRIRRSKKKTSESAFAAQKAYDPQSYLQNFDEGSSTIEPDNLYRSFSARYANPSRFNQRKELIDV